MEEELNLCELLKGYEGITLYSPAYGAVTLNEVITDHRPNVQTIKCYTKDDPQGGRVWFLSNGKINSEGEVMLFPSENDRDWNGWMCKSPWWRAADGADYWFVRPSGLIAMCKESGSPSDDARHALGNYFRYQSNALQAVEHIRECLMDLHENIIGE